MSQQENEVIPVKSRWRCCYKIWRPERWSGNAGNALSHFIYQINRPWQRLRTHNRWPFFRRYLRPVDRSHFTEAAAGGELALIRTGDRIEIDVPGRKLNVILSEKEMETRAAEERNRGEKAYKPATRNRVISGALKAYSSLVSSADTGAVRII